MRAGFDQKLDPEKREVGENRFVSILVVDRGDGPTSPAEFPRVHNLMRISPPYWQFRQNGAFWDMGLKLNHNFGIGTTFGEPDHMWQCARTHLGAVPGGTLYLCGSALGHISAPFRVAPFT